MTDDEFMDNMKSRGITIYRCIDCGKRMWGGATSGHELMTGHTTINEDKLKEQNNVANKCSH